MALFSTFYPILDIAPSGPASEGNDANGYIYGPWDKIYRAFTPWTLSPTKLNDQPPNTQQYTRSTDTDIVAPYRQHCVNYVSPPLKAQTLGGTIDLVLGLRQINADMQYRYRLVVWISNGANYANLARGLALDYTDPAGRFFPVVATGWGLPAPQPLAPIAIQAGDHLVVEVGVVAGTWASTSRYAEIDYAAVTGPPPVGVAQPDLTVGSTATLTHAGRILFSQPLSVADPPACDSCATPIIITTLPYQDAAAINVELATYDPTTDLAASCGSAGQGIYNTIWYQWTAAASGTLRIETKPTYPAPPGLSMGDSALTAYTGSCGALTEVACGVGYNGYGALLILPVTAGTTYRFRVGGRFHLDSAAVAIAARLVTVPANDNFANATLISALPFTDSTDTTLATAEVGEPASADGWTPSAPKNTVWYKWVADATAGNIRVNTLGSTYDSQVTIWAGTTWGALTEVFSAPWTNTTGVLGSGYYDQANCVFRPTPGVTYYITVVCDPGAYWNTKGGSHLAITISRVTPPPNETCATAVTIPSIPHYHTYDFTNASDAILEVVPLGDCTTFTMAENDSGKALWFKWTADRTGPMNFNTFGAPNGGPYTEVLLYTGSCGALVPLMCDGLNLNSWQTQLFFTAVAGTTYYWRIDSQGRIEGALYFFLDDDHDTLLEGDVVVGCDYIYLFAASGGFRRLVGAGGNIPTDSGTDPVSGLLYQSLFASSEILRLNGRLETLGSFLVAPGITPEVPAFFLDGRLFVGHWGAQSTWGTEGLVDPTFAIRQFDPDTGVLEAVHLAEQELTGTAWIDPASDQHTLVYTSYGRRLLRYDTQAGVQLPDFARLPGEWPTYQARGLRQRPNGEYLVADRTEVKRISAAGVVLQAYSIPGTGVGPDGTTGLNDDLNVIDQSASGDAFWVGDQDSTDVHQVDVATGAILLTLPGGPLGLYGYHNGAGQLCGISVIGGYRAGTTPPTPEPSTVCAAALPFEAEPPGGSCPAPILP